MGNIAWHFTGSTLRGGRPIPPIGHTLVFHRKIEMCVRGYHWSRTPWQALQYAPGALLHKVQVGGTIIEEPNDKGVSSERTILASIDATYLLRRFAADQALSVAHLWQMPEVVREYLMTLDQSKRDAAWDAARDAARAAATDAARAAARAAAWAAARAAARAAAWDAAWDAARDATRAAATDAARAAATDAARAAATDAARDAAWAAAWAAARNAARQIFNALVDDAFKMEAV